MREMVVELGGRELRLVANFAASVRIAKEVEDPITISRELLVSAMMDERGFSYNPRFKLTVENIPQLLKIGLDAAGEKWTKEEVQELVFDASFAEAGMVVMEYVALIIGPKPEEVNAEAGGGKSPEK